MPQSKCGRRPHLLVKYNHLLVVDMAGRGLWCACGWKNVKRNKDGSL